MTVDWRHLPTAEAPGCCGECGAGLAVALDAGPLVDPAWSAAMVGTIFCASEFSHDVTAGGVSP